MDSKHSKIVTKLNRQTKENIVVWEMNHSKPSSLSGSENMLDNVYTSRVLNKNLRLYKYQAKYFIDEMAYEWTEAYRLEFIDAWGNSEWAFPDDRAIFDLYETVRYKTSNIESFMENFLTEEEQSESDEETINF